MNENDLAIMDGETESSYTFSFDDLEDKLIANCQTKLNETPYYKVCEVIKELSDEEILNNIARTSYSSFVDYPDFFKKYLTRMSIYYKSEKADYQTCSVPFSIESPTATKVLLSIFAGVIVLLALLSIIFSDIVLGVITVVALGIFYKTLQYNLRTKANDLALVREIRQVRINRLREKRDQIEQFKKQINSNDIFYLENAIAELISQQEDFAKEKVEFDDDIRQNITDARKRVEERVEKIREQLKGMHKIRADISDQAYEEKEKSLRELEQKLIAEVNAVSPYESALADKITGFDPENTKTLKAIEVLTKKRANLIERDRLLNEVSQLTKENRSFFNIEEVRKSRFSKYEGEIQNVIAHLKNLDDYVEGIYKAYNDAIDSMPHEWFKTK